MLSYENKGHIKLVEFGNAKFLKPGEKTTTSCGTAIYIAPEILNGTPHDARVDVWSLGILISELISGETPFQATTTKQVYENINCGMFKFSKKLNKAV